MFITPYFLRDFFLDKQREKAKLEAETKLIVTMKQLIPAGEAKPIAPLGVILSQYYLNLAEFCKNFNNLTNLYEDGILIPTKIIKGLRSKEYQLYFKQPTISFLLDCISTNYHEFYITNLYDILRFLHLNMNGKKPKSLAFLIFSSLSSYNKRKYKQHKINIILTR
jgi:hypothetical protein